MCCVFYCETPAWVSRKYSSLQMAHGNDPLSYAEKWHAWKEKAIPAFDHPVARIALVPVWAVANTVTMMAAAVEMVVRGLMALGACVISQCSCETGFRDPFNDHLFYELALGVRNAELIKTVGLRMFQGGKDFITSYIPESTP